MKEIFSNYSFKTRGLLSFKLFIKKHKYVIIPIIISIFTLLFCLWIYWISVSPAVNSSNQTFLSNYFWFLSSVIIISVPILWLCTWERL